MVDNTGRETNNSTSDASASGTIVKRPEGMITHMVSTNHSEKPKNEDAPKLPEGSTDAQAVSAIDAWKHSDFLCRNYIMNCLHDSLYNVYQVHKTAKALWESLDWKYKTEDAGAKKFVVEIFLDYKMVDSKILISQVQEIQIILHEILAEGMILSETFQVAAVIEKPPPGWKDFKNYLKHKRKEMSMEDLIVRLRIEEDNRGSDCKALNSFDAKTNIVEYKQEQNSKGKRPNRNFGAKGKISKQKFQGKCFNCDKKGHKSTECKLPKKKKHEANLLDRIEGYMENMNLTTVVSEVNMMGSNPKEWWIDTGATRHV
ncbi:uncharacterized protein LOC113768370 [Coffea eugenioides]|uniref:uncharacterized protein LOC113768370 n=1 Tax=Coffea eugenioides TaxID=49369 RepID=UPI000F6096B9|nr:uncharacterized protein LOC113768370 [Coffea eugenioides]